jgi:hypothetical protein
MRSGGEECMGSDVCSCEGENCESCINCCCSWC